MSASEVVFDSWAWLEVLAATPIGQRLNARFTNGGVVTPALAVTEVAGKFWRAGATWKEADPIVTTMRTRSRIHALDDDVAALAAQLLPQLRKRDAHASYADAVMLATARTLGLPLISNDKAFTGCPDVRPE